MSRRSASDFLLNTVAVMLVAGVLFWLQPAVLSAPYDGVFTYLNAVQTAQWQPPGQSLGGYYPLEGMGSRLMPSVPLLQPHLVSLWLTPDPSTRVWLTYLILTALLALATLVYFRAAGVSRGIAIAATWLNVVLSATGSDLARATWRALDAQIGMLVALTLFLPVGGGSRRWNVGWALGSGLAVVLFLLADHVFFGYLACPVLGVALLVTTLAAPTRAERLWKLGALAGTALAILALGLPQWMLALAASIARAVFFDEILAQPQYARNAGLIFRSTDSFTIVYALAILGAAFEMVRGDRRRRALAAIPVLLSVGLAPAGLVFLTTDIRWRLPAPAYFNVFLFPWLALLAMHGLDWLFRWAAIRVDELPGRRWLLVAAGLAGVLLLGNLALGAATLVTVGLLAAIVGAVWIARLPAIPSRVARPTVLALAVVLVLFTGETVRIDWWRGGVQDGADDGRNGVQQVFAARPPFTRLLRERVGVTPGSQFRGYADSLILFQRMPLVVPLEILAWHGQDIPTLSQYTYYLTPELYALMTRLLEHPADHPNVNHLGISKVDVRVMRMLGLRYLMVKDNLDVPGLSRIDRQGDFRLYEIADPNLASFSPTRVQRAPDAAGLLETLANPAFDPRADLAVTTDAYIPGDLVPAGSTSLTFERGGFRFTGRSSGRSLVVLPVQYTRCLDVWAVQGTGAEMPRAVRVNLAQTGLIFTGEVEIEGRYRPSGPWQRCIQDDIAEVERLGLREVVRRERVPEYSHPGPRLPIFAQFGLD